jgi:hypothetical protein
MGTQLPMPVVRCQLEQKTKVDPKLPKELRTVIGKEVEDNQKKLPTSRVSKEPSIVQGDKVEVPTEDPTEVHPEAEVHDVNTRVDEIFPQKLGPKTH